MNIFEKLSQAFESQAELARILKLNSSRVVSNWKHRGSIPSSYWPQIVEASEGTIQLEDFYQT